MDFFQLFVKLFAFLTSLRFSCQKTFLQNRSEVKGMIHELFWSVKLYFMTKSMLRKSNKFEQGNWYFSQKLKYYNSSQ